MAKRTGDIESEFIPQAKKVRLDVGTPRAMLEENFSFRKCSFLLIKNHTNKSLRTEPQIMAKRTGDIESEFIPQAKKVRLDVGTPRAMLEENFSFRKCSFLLIKNHTNKNKKPKNVTRCRDGMPKSMQTK